MLAHQYINTLIKIYKQHQKIHTNAIVIKIIKLKRFLTTKGIDGGQL